MKNLRLALGYRTEHRNSEPAVLAVGFSQPALQSAVNSAPAEFRRFEFGTFLFSQRARRAAGATPAETPESFPIEGPTDEDALAMLAEIERLRAIVQTLEAQAASHRAELAEARLVTPWPAPAELPQTEKPPVQPHWTGPAAIDAESSDSPAAEATSSAAAEDGTGPTLDMPAHQEPPSRSRRR